MSCGEFEQAKISDINSESSRRKLGEGGKRERKRVSNKDLPPDSLKASVTQQHQDIPLRDSSTTFQTIVSPAPR